MKEYSTPSNLNVLYEDNHLIVVNKRVGDIVQADKTEDLPLSEVVKQYLKLKYNKPGAVFLGVVHRIDRPTTGVVVFAKTSKALERLNALFAQREGIQKTYWAITTNLPTPPQARICHWLTRDSRKNKSKAHIKQQPNSKIAELHYQLLQQTQRYFLLEIQLFTGRHHQIRAQLAAMNCPIKGDLKYGAKRSNPNGGIHLHARRIKFIHPIKKEAIEIIAPLPNDPIWNALSV